MEFPCYFGNLEEAIIKTLTPTPLEVGRTVFKDSDCDARDVF
jgi:hypothetical protein